MFFLCVHPFFCSHSSFFLHSFFPSCSLPLFLLCQVPSLTGPFDNEGRIIVHNLPRDVVISEFQTLLQYFGDIRKITLSNKALDSSSYIVEYFDLRSSSEACAKLNRHVVENRVLKVNFLNGYTSWAVAGFAPPAPPPIQMPSRRQSVDLPQSTFQDLQGRRHSVDLAASFLHDPQARRHSIDVAGGFQDSHGRHFSFPSPSSSSAHTRSPSPNSPTHEHPGMQNMMPLHHPLATPPSPNTSASAQNSSMSSFTASPSSSQKAPSSSASFPPSPPSSPPSQMYSSPPHHHHHHAAQQQQQPHHVSPHHGGIDSKHHPNRIPDSFQIDLDAIKSGVDKRTTLMIRNIPNKYTQDMFLDFVNETHNGKYDFIYLPIDFKNKCNVGYSFVNFIDPKSISTLFTRIQGKKWTRFNSEKICAVSYARIQGKENLIRHFQNSTYLSLFFDFLSQSQRLITLFLFFSQDHERVH